MKRITSLMIAIFLMQFNSFAQDFFEEISTGIASFGMGTLTIGPNDHMFITSGFEGFCRSTDYGKSWITVFGDRYPGPMAINSNNVIFISGQRGAFRSTDDGENWLELTTGWMENWVINSNNCIFGLTEPPGCRILRSTDDGINWTDVTNGLNNIVYLTNNSHDYLYAGAWGSKIFRSTDNGNSWVEIDKNFPGYPLNYLASFVINSNDYIFAVTDSATFRSTDNGENWSEIIHKRFWNFVMNSKQDIFATELGVFRSTDYGDGWDQIWYGLNAGSGIDGLGFDSKGYLYAGQLRTMYRSINPTTPVKDDNTLFPIRFSLLQNYPNPFKPTTKIEYSIPKTSIVTLKIYDILGREVAALVNEEKTVGVYNVDFNSGGLFFGEKNDLT